MTAGWQDADWVLRFAQAKSANFGSGPAQVMIVGYSAGAVMALAGDDFDGDGDCLVSGFSTFPEAFF